MKVLDWNSISKNMSDASDELSAIKTDMVPLIELNEDMYTSVNPSMYTEKGFNIVVCHQGLNSVSYKFAPVD